MRLHPRGTVLISIVLLSELLKLTDEAFVGMDDLPLRLHQRIGLLVTHLFILDEIGQDQTHRSGHSCQAVDHNVSFL